LGPDGTIYFGAYGTLYAITNGGSNAWQFPTQNAKDSSPAVAWDGTIYYSSMTSGSPGSGYLYAISPLGKEKWRYPSQGGNGSPAIAADGTIYVTGGYYLHAIAPDGTNKWKYPIGGGDYSAFVSPTVEPDDTALVGSIDSRAFYSITGTGSLVWNFSLGVSGPGDSAAVEANGTVYFTGRPLYAFSPAVRIFGALRQTPLRVPLRQSGEMALSTWLHPGAASALLRLRVSSCGKSLQTVHSRRNTRH